MSFIIKVKVKMGRAVACNDLHTQVVYRALTCCLPGMRVMLLEARSRLTKTKKPEQVLLLLIILILKMPTVEKACNKSKPQNKITAPHHPDY